MDATTGMLLQLVLLMWIAAIWGYFKAMNQIRIYRESKAAPAGAADAATSSAPPASVVAPPPVDSRETIPGAGQALVAPPADLLRTNAYLKANYPTRRYTFPIGWKLSKKGEPTCTVGHFEDDVYHILITGQSRGGKDNLAMNMLLALAWRYTPQQFQLCVIDGKGLDFVGWEGKAHAWHLGLTREAIKPAMEAISAERERRRDVLAAADVVKWESYKGGDLPLLVVYVSELSLLEDAVGKSELTAWLNSELAAGAAFGMRFVIATQTVSNFGTRWRSQIGLYLAGFQASQSQDQPNTGLTTAEISAAGGVPPSELPAPPRGAGVFTAVQGRQAVTIRAGLMDDAQRKRLLDSMPNRAAAHPAPTPAPLPSSPGPQALLELLVTGQPLPIGDTPASVPGRPDAENGRSVPFRDGVPAVQNLASSGTSDEDGTGQSGTVIEVPAEERAQILALAESGMSRRKIADQLYGGRSKYDRVKFVLDSLEQAA